LADASPPSKSKTASQFVWPRLTDWPTHAVPLVYLDLNHWIYLAQARAGLSSGVRFVSALEACRNACSSGTARFVLSGSHYMEMVKIRDPAQRRTIADVMEELTDFSVLVSRVVIMELELEAALNRFVVAAPPLSPVALVGHGARHAFGIQSGLRVMGPEGDATEEVRQRMGAEHFDAFVANAHLLLERSVLRGPTDDEVPTLQQYGWNPAGAAAVAIKRAEEEQAQSGRLNEEGGRWRRGRLRDVVAARELLIEFQNMLPRALALRALTLEHLGSNPETAMAFVRSMPSTEVSIEIKTAWHRNGGKRWTPNDIYDIDALSLAIPYCDIVVTEKACHHLLNAARLGERMRTVILRRLDDLPAAIDRWIPPAGDSRK
jgi:hypothetical protein